MVKMENQSNLQVTFSKRRAGLFKKASELCTLCGAEVALVVFSPANKVYCFGHPGLQTIIDRFVNEAAPMPTNGTSQMILEAHRNSTIRELNLELTQVESMLRAEKNRGENLDLQKKEGKKRHWFPPSFDGFKYSQLCVMKETILELAKKVDVKVEKEMFRLANPFPTYPSPLPLQREKENPRVFGFPFGVEPNVPCVPTFDDPFSLGSSNFSPFAHRAMGFSNNGLFPPAVAPAGPTSDPLMTSGSTPVSFNHRRAGSGFEVSHELTPNFSSVGEGYGLMSSGLSSSRYFGGGNNSASTSSMLPFDSIGNRGFRDGFRTGCGPSIKQASFAPFVVLKWPLSSSLRERESILFWPPNRRIHHRLLPRATANCHHATGGDHCVATRIALLESEKRRGEELSCWRKENQGGGRWWEASIKEMGVKELEHLKETMEDLRKNASREAEKLMVEKAVVVGSLPPSFLGVVPEDYRGGDGDVDVDARVSSSALGQLSMTK
ncbi:hypothetical protein BUALT_Bualt15G0054200 [Buddleja alternifolia]|uniref:MADS-box domain-containing protein n=1 Tax=Buddleja alternifolia TaxID=168488 RepID=A0AAV6WNG0_9LAMI|nr:hypothetical protein BUALT_Bualt15G0054200 [Buddleja alternifolia]